jgi:hypothetical protein
MIRFLAWLVVVATTFGNGLPSAAQSAAEPPAETKIVLRVSRGFIHQLTGVHFRRTESMGKDSVAGNAQVLGKFDVKLRESETESAFDLRFDGAITTQMTTTRRPVEVHTHGTGSFCGQRRIVFEGKGFAGQPIELSVAHHSTVDAIHSLRGGLRGAIARRVAAPMVSRYLPGGDRQLAEEIRSGLSKTLEQETDNLMTVINNIRPIIRRGEELLIEDDLIPKGERHVYRAATKDYLMLSLGSANRRIARLPELEASKRAPLELWIAKREESKERRLQFFLKHWQLVVPLIEEQLARHDPELAKALDKKLHKVQMESVAGWHVVTFAPELRDLLVDAVPAKK